MTPRIVPRQPFPPLRVRNIHGIEISVPDTDRWTHLQFRRFAGCPVCNLHLQSFVARHDELANRAINEVVVFHSSDEELLPYQGRFPFDVVSDPKKTLYHRYGVEASIWAVVDPRAWLASLKGNLRRDKPVLKGMPNGGILGLPADFLIAPDGNVVAAHYGQHADDQWSVDEVLQTVP
ncbi:peroxiredoxin-like family protein [Paraburkholderia tropica]|uniref:peroxiredoxin-like family protein n=1 Tax=Paraburkholderia tropica TaxID=92647 RepID=UPI002AB0665F|nr:peroxiredoxin-like family protein [Paraburkholderia tropica]